MHEKAFEIGMYFIDNEFKIWLNKAKENDTTNPLMQAKVAAFEGMQIREGAVKPSLKALSHYWKRVGVDRRA